MHSRKIKMIFDQSLSFKGRKLDTMFSICPSSPQMEQRTISDLQALRINSREEFLEKKSRCIATRTPKSALVNHQDERYEAALKLQKVYKSFRTRRQLADCAVLAEQKWWKLLDAAELKRSSISFFDIEKPETAISRWSRARTRAAKVGKGSSKDAKARKLALQHWLEAIDPRHRYGHNLQFYYIRWLQCESKQPFFYWLDIGEGREVTLERCPRPRLQQQCIKYLGPMERKAYEVMVENGKFFYREQGQLIDTSGGPKDAKWIFVLSTSKTMYVGMKNKGTFQHSSFLAGGATLSAGRLVVEHGTLKAVWPHSGHYLPTEENFQEFMSFLTKHNVDLSKVKKSPSEEEEAAIYGNIESNQSEADSSRSFETTDGQKPIISSKPGDKNIDAAENTNLPSSWCQLIGSRMSKLKIPKPNCSGDDMLKVESPHEQSCSAESPGSESEDDYETPGESFSDQDSIIAKLNLFDNKQEEDDKEPIPREKIMQRIDSHKGLRSYQLAQHLSCRWTTGAGPRIGCMRDYPSELQVRVLEETNMSPRAAKVSPSRRAMSRFSSKHGSSACREETADRSPLTPERFMLYQTATP